MTRIFVRGVVGLALIGAGWAAAKAQTSSPEFELVVSAPAGETHIQCVQGCTLRWVERGINPDDAGSPTFSFKCSGAAVERCSSGRVGGWLTP